MKFLIIIFVFYLISIYHKQQNNYEKFSSKDKDTDPNKSFTFAMIELASSLLFYLLNSVFSYLKLTSKNKKLFTDLATKILVVLKLLSKKKKDKKKSSKKSTFISTPNNRTNNNNDTNTNTNDYSQYIDDNFDYSNDSEDLKNILKNKYIELVKSKHKSEPITVKSELQNIIYYNNSKTDRKLVDDTLFPSNYQDYYFNHIQKTPMLNDSLSNIKVHGNGTINLNSNYQKPNIDYESTLPEPDIDGKVRIPWKCLQEIARPWFYSCEEDINSKFLKNVNDGNIPDEEIV